MTTSGDRPEPLDPAFAGLFRADEPAAEPPSEPPDAAPVDPVPAPGPSPAVTLVEPSVDTGRLFRSQGVDGHGDAVLALPRDRAGRLRTAERRTDEPAPEAAVATLVAPEESADGLDAGEAAVAGSGGSAAKEPRRRSGRRSMPAGAVYLVVIGVTLLAGFAEALLFGDIGWVTGVALVASTVYCALTVRRQDDTVAIITPPIAFLLVGLTAAQLSMGSVEGTLLNRAVVVFFTLADNWPWIIGATAAALVIVLVRRRGDGGVGR